MLILFENQAVNNAFKSSLRNECLLFHWVTLEIRNFLLKTNSYLKVKTQIYIQFKLDLMIWNQCNFAVNSIKNFESIGKWLWLRKCQIFIYFLSLLVDFILKNLKQAQNSCFFNAIWNELFIWFVQSVFSKRNLIIVNLNFLTHRNDLNRYEQVIIFS